MRSRLAAVLASTVLLSVLAACGSSEESDNNAADKETTPSSKDSSADCEYVKGEKASKEADLPPTDPKAVTALTIATNRGDFKATLTPDSAPCTVNSFVSLAEQGWFDGIECHRLVPGFVLQCGDPTGAGNGGPGYSFKDELSGEETYPKGTLAMANSGPDTNGSQFFIVLADAKLPPSYTVFGAIDEAGMKAALDIAAKGNASNGVAPAQKVVIESVS
jgi:peptidyl-prolyl cis-trans isomerase B (cyclophilin B)